VKLAAAQCASVPGDIVANVQRHVATAERAAALGVDVVVFPELSLIGYAPTLAAATAVDPGDARLAPLQDASDRLGIVLAVGAPLAAADLPKIAMLVFRPYGSVVVHAKRRLHADELPWFAPGADATTLDVGGHRLAPAICYEALQHEHVDAVVSLGATVYLASVAKHARGVAEAHETLAAVARERQLTVVLANAVGAFTDGVAGGRSAVWRADGTLAAGLDATSEGLVSVVVDDR
jgi:predicted amidohydrolase